MRIATNLVGAGGAAYFSHSYLIYFVHSRQPLGAVFFAQQMIVVIAYLVRRPAGYLTRRADDWLLAFGGTFAGVLARTSGVHQAGWVQAGLALQLIGAAIAMTSLVVLGRSFGFAAADRGLVTRGPYAISPTSVVFLVPAVRIGFFASERFATQHARPHLWIAVQCRPSPGRGAPSDGQWGIRCVSPPRPAKNDSRRLVTDRRPKMMRWVVTSTRSQVLPLQRCMPSMLIGICPIGGGLRFGLAPFSASNSPSGLRYDRAAR